MNLKPVQDVETGRTRSHLKKKRRDTGEAKVPVHMCVNAYVHAWGGREGGRGRERVRERAF